MDLCVCVWVPPSNVTSRYLCHWNLRKNPNAISNETATIQNKVIL